MDQQHIQQVHAALALAEKYRKEAEMMRQLSTFAGFYLQYFNNLKDPAYKTQAECFHAVNDLYELLFGRPKYSDYESFKNQCRRNKIK